jgi:hypothetical protein
MSNIWQDQGKVLTRGQPRDIMHWPRVCNDRVTVLTSEHDKSMEHNKGMETTWREHDKGVLQGRGQGPYPGVATCSDRRGGRDQERVAKRECVRSVGHRGRHICVRLIGSQDGHRMYWKVKAKGNTQAIDWGEVSRDLIMEACADETAG